MPTEYPAHEPVFLYKHQESEDDVFEFVFGINEETLKYYIERGLSHTYDFSKQGVPLKIVLFGAKTRGECENQIKHISKPTGDA